MGYRSHVEGRIEFHPPVPADSSHIAALLPQLDLFDVPVDEHRLEAPNGYAVARSVGRIVPCGDPPSGDRHDWARELCLIVDAVTSHAAAIGAPHPAWRGRFHGEGLEGEFDHWRLWVEANRTRLTSATLSWPESLTGDLLCPCVYCGGHGRNSGGDRCVPCSGSGKW